MITPQFLESLVTGHLSSWDTLYDEYAPLLYGVIRQQIPAEISASVLEIAFVNIYRRLHEFQPDKQRLFTWMYKVTLETCALAKVDVQDAAKKTWDSMEPGVSEIALA